MIIICDTIDTSIINMTVFLIIAQTVKSAVTIVDNIEDWPGDVVREESNE